MVFPDGTPVEQSELDVMSATLVHRGPDGTSSYIRRPERNVGLAHTRLAIIDLENGVQPMCNEDGTVRVVFNGEIYNYRELRNELSAQGHSFRTDSDTEVLVHLYEELGPRLVERLIGMFAFAIWDERRGELTLARDRLGQKPLYWSVQDRRLYFASESRAIVALPGVARDIDPVSMDYYLRLWYIPAPRSIWRGMNQLPPATTMTWRPSSGEQKPVQQLYWRPCTSPHFDGSEEDACEELRRLVRQAVGDRMRSDVPLGAFLSGGLDSTVIVGQMCELGAGKLRTFSVGFPENDYSELPFARQVARMYGTEHTEITVSSGTVEDLERVAGAFDEPMGDSSALPTFRLCQNARSVMTVAVTGDAGDENFGGYLRYGPLASAQEVRPFGMRSELLGRLADWRCHWRVSPYKNFLVHRLCRQDELYFRLMSVCNDDLLRRLYTPGAARAVAPSPVRAWFNGLFEQGRRHGKLGSALYADLLSYLPFDLNTKIDRSSMAFGLEVRSPLEDHRLVEFACSLPVHWKVRREPGGELTTKWIFKKAFAGAIPAELVHRPKMGFAVPLQEWLAGPWASFAREVLGDRRTRERGIFRTDHVIAMLDEHARGRRDSAQEIWQLLFLEMWMRQHLDEPRKSSPSEPADSRQTGSHAAKSLAPVGV